jgi:outer membrane receptor protein involved in Fe transport
LQQALHDTLDLDLGVESIIRRIERPPLPPDVDPNLIKVINETGTYSASSLYLQAVFRPTPRLRFIPGLRFDLYDERRISKTVTKAAFDPRLLARFRLSDAFTLKGVVGRYHQPPRIFVPIPGIDSSSLELGLLASTQYSVGVEARLTPQAELDANVYYNAMDPILFDLVLNPSDSTRPPDGQLTLENLFTPRRGRSYGFELLLRKRDTERLFGWISYTLSHSERHTPDGWSPFDFDRTHILNVVAGVRLPRNWEFGTRVLYQSGSPLNARLGGHNLGRSDGQFRLDLRIDKRAVWNSWLLDFYVDIINAAVTEESGGLVGNESFRYLLPTVGFRALL